MITAADYIAAIFTTLKITIISTLLAYIIGIPLGVLLYGTDKSGIFPNSPVNKVVGVVVNIIRSIPFVILLVMTQPVAKLLVGKKIGDNAFIVYLVIEAAQSMGSNNLQLIMKVLIPEAKPSLIVGSAIAITTILGYTPMTYLIAGGGLGQMAIQYGLYRFNKPAMYISSLLLIVLVQIMQESLNFIAKKCDKRIRNK